MTSDTDGTCSSCADNASKGDGGGDPTSPAADTSPPGPPDGTIYVEPYRFGDERDVIPADVLSSAPKPRKGG